MIYIKALSWYHLCEAFVHLNFQVYEMVISGASKRAPLAGTMFWMTAARSYEDYDGTTIYLTPPIRPGTQDAANLQIVEIIRKHTIDLGRFNLPFGTS